MESWNFDKALIKHSVTLNAVLGALLFFVNLYLSRYYVLGFIKRIHLRALGLSGLQRSLIQALFSAVPHCLYHMADGRMAPEERLSVAQGSAFFGLALGLAAVAMRSGSDLVLDLKLFNRFALCLIVSAAAICTGSLGRPAAIATGALLPVVLAAALRGARKHDFPLAQNARAARGAGTAGLLDFFKPLFYPFEVFFDYSIVIYGGKSKVHMLSFSKRAFISPVLNALLVLLYLKLELGRAAAAGILAAGLLCSTVLLACSRRPKLYDLIALYSFVVACGYLYVLAREQISIARILGARRGLAGRKMLLLLIVPQMGICSLVVDAYFSGIGLAHVSAYAVLIGSILSAALAACLSIALGLAGRYSLLADRVACSGLLLLACLGAILAYYINLAGGRLLRELSPICLFLAGSYLWVVYKCDQ